MPATQFDSNDTPDAKFRLTSGNASANDKADDRNDLAKVEVAGSSPVYRSIKAAGQSAGSFGGRRFFCSRLFSRLFLSGATGSRAASRGCHTVGVPSMDNMAGHAKERRPGVWELRVYLGRDPLTKKPLWSSKTVAAAGKKKAQLLADEFALEVSGTALDAQTVTVGELLERWWQFGVDTRLWSPGTEKLHREYIDGYFAPLRDKRLAVLRTLELDEYFAALRSRGGRSKKGLATSTVVRVAGALSLALDQAVRWELVKTNPCDNAQPGRLDKKTAGAPDPVQVLRLVAAARELDAEFLCYVFLDAESGARRGEVAALRLDDFTDDAVTIARALAIGLESEQNARRYAGHYWPAGWSRGRHRTAMIEKTPKNKQSQRTIALAPATLELVHEQVARLRGRSTKAERVYPDDGFLFPHATSNGTTPLRPDTWTARFAKIRAEAKVTGVRLHDLRHYVATQLLAAGVDLATVAGRLGHGGGGKTTLAIYGHATKHVDRRASDVMAELLRDDAVEVEGARIVPLRRATND